MQYTKNKQIPSLALVENPLSPIAREADIAITLKRGPNDQLNSLAVPISICHALMIELNLLKQEQALENMENLESLTKLYQSHTKENKNEK